MKVCGFAFFRSESRCAQSMNGECTNTNNKKTKLAPVRLSLAGICGYEAIEPVILASPVTDPVLLIGRYGTGKTFPFSRLL